MAIVADPGTTPARVVFDIFNTHDLQFQNATGSILVPGDSNNVMTVGAVAWNNPATLEYFSSQGPAKHGASGPDVYKPDIVAPDGVSTATYGTTAFYGTSAAAPYAAGAAALVKQQFPGFSPIEIRSYLENLAVDLGPAGKDNQFGSGRLNLGNLSPRERQPMGLCSGPIATRRMKST